MLRLCKSSVESSVQLLAKEVWISTLSTAFIFTRQTNPQEGAILHNKLTRFSTRKNDTLTDGGWSLSTLSTNTITTTTYI